MSSDRAVGAALVGVGGQGVTHVAALQHLQQQGLVELRAVVEANPQGCAGQLDELRRSGVAVEPDLPALLERWQGKVALVGVPVGIPGHRPIAEAVLRAGYTAVLEKPPVGCISDFGPLLAAAGRAGRPCAVHFQTIWSKGFRAVKEAIVAGRIGRLQEVRIKGRWFREDQYYGRNRWAGRLRVGNTWVLDGTINNPFGHQVNNALFLAGEGLNDWASPVEVRAELYHARPGIFGDDTTCLAVRTDTGVTLRLWLTLCSEKPQRQVTIQAIGQGGQVTWPLQDGTGQVRHADGQVETIAADDTPGSVAVYANVCRHLRGQDERIPCTLADTRPFVQTVSAAYEVAGPPGAIPGRFVRRAGTAEKPGFVIDGIDDAIDGCFETGSLFSEAGLPWAHGAKGMPVGPGYDHFRPAWDR